MSSALREAAGLFLRGLAMGAVELVPGVSSGTVAFVTGIYPRLLNAIRAFRPRLWQVFKVSGWRGVWREIDGRFLLILGLGVVTGVLSLAGLISAVLETSPVAAWAFFFGLIAGSALLLMRQIRPWNAGAWLLLALGVAAATVIALGRPGEMALTPFTAFAGGMLAICAMLLPGVSGSFVLLILGLYAPILLALTHGDWLLVLFFIAGCGTGLLSFSHLLGYLLEYWRQPVMALLTGFLIGSLILVWPWKAAGDSSARANLLPWDYAAAVGDSLLSLLPGLLLMAAGFALVALLERLGQR